MKTRILATTAVLAALAGCAPTTTVNPVTEDIFYSGAPVTATAIEPAPVTIVEEIGPDGEVVDPALAMVEEDPFGQTIETVGGLTERLPDTCKLENYQQFRGMTAADVQAAGIAAPFRVVAPDAIVTQEYNPMRVNFFTNEGGLIGDITCG